MQQSIIQFFQGKVFFSVVHHLDFLHLNTDSCRQRIVGKDHSVTIMPGFILRISSYSWKKKQQHFSNTRSRVILIITRPKLSPQYRRDKLGINSGQEKMAAHFDDDDDLWELAELYVVLFPPRCRANPLTCMDEVEFRARFVLPKQK